MKIFATCVIERNELLQKKGSEKTNDTIEIIDKEDEQAIYRKTLQDERMSHNFTNKTPEKWQSWLIRHAAFGVSTVN